MGLSRGMLPSFQFISQRVPLPGELSVAASHVASCRVRQPLGLCGHLAALRDPLGRCSSPKIFRRKVVVHFASSEALHYAKRVMTMLVTPNSKFI